MKKYFIFLSLAVVICSCENSTTESNTENKTNATSQIEVEKKKVEVPKNAFLAIVKYDKMKYFVKPDGSFLNVITNSGSVSAFEDALPFSEGLAGVKINGKWGFIDGAGNIIIEPVFFMVNSFQEGLAPVSKNGKYGFIDKESKWVINEQFTISYSNLIGMKPFSNGLAPVRVNSNDSIGFINAKGEWAISPRYFGTDGFEGNYAKVFIRGRINERYIDTVAYVDKSGNLVDYKKPENNNKKLFPKYLYVSEFSEGLAKVNYGRHNYIGFIDRSGKEIIPCQYGSALPFKFGLAPVKEQSSSTGLIDEKTGAPLAVSGLWGYMDKNGNWVIAPTFADALQFECAGKCDSIININSLKK